MLTAELVKLRQGAFVQGVIEPCRNNIAKFWMPELINQIEEDNRDLLLLYRSNQVLRVAIDLHDNNTTFGQS